MSPPCTPPTPPEICACGFIADSLLLDSLLRCIRDEDFATPDDVVAVAALSDDDLVFNSTF